ncbi:MAG: serine/threonine protein kinase [Deltaproteobacteria bacterium]|nr:serine/threonine protein kinase [Deltaproteobacteria bacterium]
MAFFPEQKPVKFGRYLLLDRINVGGMAEVFRGKTGGVEGFERMVALKRILPNIAADPDFITMFVDEAKLAVQLQHANIAQIYDLGKVDEIYFIAMEYISGVDLRTMWDRARNRNRLLPIAMSCHIMQKACEGLDAAHRKKDQDGVDISLVHRDVSPQNVLISFEGEVKIIDFGIARAAGKVSKTQAGVLKGKFGYMSPEQVRGVDLDNRSDIFACGVVLYELLVGDRLFLGESDFSTLEKVRNVEMVPPTRLNKNLSPQLERIVMKALAKNREDRYRWASEMAEDLQRYLFSTNQPFARTDLQRYMAQHFKEELVKEKARLDKYKSITAADAEEERRAVEEARELHTEVAEVRDRPGPAPANGQRRDPTGLRAAPLSFQDAVIPVAPPPPPVVIAPPAKPRLPTWAAGVIGGLLALIVAVGGILAYVATTKPSPGALTITATPNNAEISINDRLVSNQSPYTLDNLEPNTYVLSVSAEGYEKVIRAVKVGPGESRLETVVLPKKAGTASIIILTQPEGLKVFLNGVDTQRLTPATLTGLIAGDQSVVLKRDDGVIVHRFRMGLVDGAAERVEIDTKKLPPVLDVTSTPAGATLKVNGQIKGNTPITVSGLKEGQVAVTLESPGCKTFSANLRLERATVVPFDAQMECGAAPPPPTVVEALGKINVSATVVADIYVDGEKIGRTPALSLVVKAGKRTLRLVPMAEGKTPWETELMIDPSGETKDIHHEF